jgi:polar amino acid transport system permease protein
MDVLRQLIDLHLVWHYRTEMLRGFLLTLELAGATFVLALTVAVPLAVARTRGPRIVTTPLAVLVTLLRSVPAVVGLVFVFFLLPLIGITFSPFISAVVTLAVIQSVYFGEIFRSGLLAVGKGQFEAGYAAGLSSLSVYGRVVLPQAFRVAAPAFASSCVQLVHNTTVASVVGLQDLVGTSFTIQFTLGSSAAMLPAALLYLVLLLPMVKSVRKMEQRTTEAGYA